MLALLTIFAGARVLASEKPLPDLITIGTAVRHAELVGIEPNDALRFRDSKGQTFSVRVSDLVRWSTPAAPRAPDELLLVDGSRLRLAATWGKDPSFATAFVRAGAKTHLLGELDLARSDVRAVLWRLPAEDAARQKRIDELLVAQSKDAKSDVLLLDNGDILAGTLSRVGESGNPFDDEEGEITARFFGGLGEIELPADRIRGIAFSPATAVPPGKAHAPKPALLVGLNDGSIVAANSMVGGEKSILRSAALGDQQIAMKDIVSLQADNERIVYLSDIDPAGYRHEPYLDLKWPYTRDRNALGGPLRVGGRTYLKGLGMHSAARLTFDLDGKYDRFAATIALDDAADGGGSVVFRVFLKPNEGGDWREAFASGGVRGGDAPQEASIDLTGAGQLALIVDYADRGDERDYANWLDARLEHP
ncbi:MAG: NPCBM/NEW2 domain-containing protein [Pirellulales bacterium]|nr:NPCBM/NEW2 domain-containing protein [Pirellulales bacterium]